jgi:hypothetical protein
MGLTIWHQNGDECIRFHPIFLVPFSFFPGMISYRFPLTWEVGTPLFFCERERIFCASLKSIQFDLSQFEWFDNPENQ